MIEHFNDRVAAEGLDAEGRVMDCHVLELANDSFDITGSQFGVMLVPDQAHALREMVRVTRPGGRVLVIAYGDPREFEALQVFVAAVQAVVPDFEGPAEDEPLLEFQVADAEVLRQRLTDAGLTDVIVDTSNQERIEMRTSGLRKFSATEPVATVGSANSSSPIGENADHYELSYSGLESGTITPAATSVTNGTLAQWDTHLRKDGDYTLKLYMKDKANNTATATAAVSIDNTPPRVSSTDPANNEMYARSDVAPKAYFTEPMRPASVNGTTYTLTGASAITGAVSYTDNGPISIGTFLPTSLLTTGQMHTGLLTTGATDIAGNPLASTFEENDASVAYGVAGNEPHDIGVSPFGAGWVTRTDSNMSGDSYNQSLTTGDWAETTFTTTATEYTGIVWAGATGPDRGIARIYVDTVDMGTVDCYSAVPQYKQSLYKLAGLSVGPHTLRIEVTGTKNGSSTGYGVDVDAFWEDVDYSWQFRVAGVEALITQPVRNQRIRGTYQVKGTAAGPDFLPPNAKWKLEYALHGEEVSGPWTQIGTDSTTPVTANNLLQWNTTSPTVLDGQYTLRLSVTDNASATMTYDVLVTVDNTVPTGGADRMLMFRDEFNSRDTSSWSLLNSFEAAPVSYEGSYVMRVVGTNVDWSSGFRRANNYALTDKDEISMDFKPTTTTTSLHLGLESSTPAGDYQRFVIVAQPTSIYIQFRDSIAGYQYPAVNIPNPANKWYTVKYKISDTLGEGLTVTVNERGYAYDDPSHPGFTWTQTMPRGLMWRFWSVMWNGDAYFDNYEEARPNSGTVQSDKNFTIAGTAVDLLSGIDKIEYKLDAGNWQPAGYPAVIDSAEATANWTAGYGSVSVNSTTFIEGAGALNLIKTSTTSTDCYFEKRPSSTINMTNKRMNAHLYIRDAAALAKIATVQFWAMETSNAWYLYDPSIVPAQLSVGWNLISLDLTNYPNKGGTGTPDLSAVSKIRIDVDTVSADTTYAAGEFIVDNWTLTPAYRIDNEVGTAAVNLVGEWHFDESAGTTAYSTGPTPGLNGTITGTDYWFYPGVDFFSGANGYVGTITTGGGYTYQTYTRNGTFSAPVGVSEVEVLAVAGGGGGGGTIGGGGGGGGLVYNGSYTVSGSMAVTVGAGGLGGIGYNNAGQTGGTGGNSSFGTITANGGGGGAGWSGYPSTSGGSGGGGSAGGAGSAGMAGQGFAGGNGDSNNYGGGGGGSASVGANYGSTGGAGGNGLSYSISGESVNYAGGGGGGARSGFGAAGTGGIGGGGTGSTASVSATSGTDNTGGGGGGAGYNGSNTAKIGGDGGSGIVIVKYPTPAGASAGNTALQFDGNDDTVTIPDNPALRLGAAQTVEAWVRVDATASNRARLVGKGNTATTENYGLWLATDGTVAYEFENSSQTVYAAQSTAVKVNDGQWHHVAGTYDGTNLKVYIDGLTAATTACTATPVTNADPVLVGGVVPGYASLIGAIDEVKIYNTPFSTNQAAQRYLEGQITSGVQEVRYSGDWRYAADGYASGGSFKTSNVIGSTTTVSFKGSSITWLGTKKSDYGVAQVLIDGVPITDGDYRLAGDTGNNKSGIDLYAPVTAYKRLLYTAKGLTDNIWHTMTIKVTGYKNGASSGTTINVDAFDTGGTTDWRAIIDTTGLSSGPHTVYTRAVDKAGNASNLTDYTFNVDSDAPLASISNPTDAQLSLTTGSTLAVNSILKIGTKTQVIAVTTALGGTWAQIADGSYILTANRTLTGTVGPLSGALTLAGGSYVATGSTLPSGTTAVNYGDTTALGGTWAYGTVPAPDKYALQANRTLPAGTNVTLLTYCTALSSHEVIGQATDSSFNYYNLEFGEGASPSKWYAVNNNPRYEAKTGASPGDLLGQWSIPWHVLYGWDAGSAEGWTTSGMTSTTYTQGAFNNVTTNTDPQVISPYVAAPGILNGSKTKNIAIRMKTTNVSTRPQLYWYYTLPETGRFMSGGVNLYIGEPNAYSNSSDTNRNTSKEGTWGERRSLDWVIPGSYVNKWVEYRLDMATGLVYGLPRTEGPSSTTGTWTTDSTFEGASGGSQVFATSAATATYSFTSPNITLVTTKAPDRGVARIYIDGVPVTDAGVAVAGDLGLAKSGVDLYAKTAIGQQVVYQKRAMTNAAHTITVEYTGTKNAASSGTRVDVDAYDEETLIADYRSGEKVYPGGASYAPSYVKADGNSVWPAAGFWQGSINQIRFDPCNVSGATVNIDYVRYGKNDGTYSLRLTAEDNAGRRKVDTHTVNVDTTPPKCLLNTPSNMAVLSSGVNIAVTGKAGDYSSNSYASGVNRVEIRVVEGVNSFAATYGPWQQALTTNGWADWNKNVTIGDGWFGIQSRSIDNAGNIRESNISYITVDNVAPPQPKIRAIPSKDPKYQGMILSWTPVKDEGSGVDYYIVLRNGKGVTTSLKYPDGKSISSIETQTVTIDLNSPATPGNPADDTTFLKFYGCNAIDPIGFDAKENTDVKYQVIAVDAGGRLSGNLKTAPSVKVHYDSRGPNQPAWSSEPTLPPIQIAGVTNTALLAWDATYDAQGVSEYRIYRDESTDGTDKSGFLAPDPEKLVGLCDVADPGSGAVTAIKFYDPNLTWGTKYFYKVVAYDDALNYSDPTPAVSITMPAAKTDFGDQLPHLAYSAQPTECSICHRAHTARGEKLINKTYEAELCFTCHDGTASNTPTKAEFDFSPSGAHRIKDDLYPSGRLSCIDCHNPHLNTEKAYFDNFDDDTAGTQPDKWTFIGGTWATTGTATVRELTQSAALGEAIAGYDTTLTSLQNKGGSSLRKPR